ncbi:MAG: CHAD domain-containing protein, partial [Planctomycetota bacterium]
MIDPKPAVEHLIEHLGRARDGEHGECIHQLRVACRRLLVFLDLADRRAFREDLRWLREAAAEVRDLEVMIQRSLPLEVVEWFTEQHSAACTRFRAELETTRASGLAAALPWLEPIPVHCVQRELVRVRASVTRRGAALDSGGDDVRRERERLHDLRRALRRLRYLLSWAGEDPPKIRRLQAALGGMNDLEQLEARLLDYPHQARIIELRADVDVRGATAHRASL